MRQAMRLVGQHLHFHRVVGLGEKGGRVHARLEVGWQHQNTAVVVAFESQLAGGADHALALHAAYLGLLQLALGQDGPHLGEGDLLAHGDVLGAAHNAHYGLAVVHVHQRELVGVRVLVYLVYPAHAHAREGSAGLAQLLHLQPHAAQLGRQDFRRRGILDIISQPRV